LTTVNVVHIDRSTSLEDPLAGDRGDGNRKPLCRLADLLAERAAEPTAVESGKTRLARVHCVESVVAMAEPT
jgi:hypothetical protein